MSDDTNRNEDGHTRIPRAGAHRTDPTRRRLIGGVAAGAAALAATSAMAQGTLNPEANTAEVAALPRFQGTSVLITGATSGIGRATAEAFAREGANVSFCGRRADVGAEVAAMINAEEAVLSAQGSATYVQCDVRDAAQVERFVKDEAARMGSLDVAFNNAGIFLPVGELQDLPLNAYRDMIETNLNGVAYAMMYELPIMIEQDTGVLINMASVAGHRGFGNTPHYNAAKHGVIGLTKAAAAANASRNIRVSSLSPLAVDTPMLEASFAEQGLTYEGVAETLVTPRIMEAAEMARAVMFLADPSTTYFTGADLDVTGGQLA